MNELVNGNKLDSRCQRYSRLSSVTEDRGNLGNQDRLLIAHASIPLPHPKPRRARTILALQVGLYSNGAVPLPEKSLIAQLRRITRSSAGRSCGRQNRAVLRGIGDDCAILRLRPDRDTLVTTDFSLEGIHFRRDWHAPDSVGHRCLVRGLSDVAAMGGEPVACFLSLAVPRKLPQSWVTNFTRGLLKLANRYGVTLAGGDTAESPDGILADIIVLGTVPKGKAILRSGARPGDRIFVSGTLGASADAVQKMRCGERINRREYHRHFYPDPRIELGRMLRQERLATAMIDLSDGLSTDLSHICEESRVGAEIDQRLIPRASIGRKLVALEFSLHGGEDYELLFTASPRRRIPAQVSGVPITEIGRIARQSGIFVTDRSGRTQKLRVGGWEHFRS